MVIKVEVKNEIIGDSVFWVGHSDNIPEIRNIVARSLAEAVAEDGTSRHSGMWYVSEVTHG